MKMNISINIENLKKLLLNGSITINWSELKTLHKYWKWENEGFIMKQDNNANYRLSITT